MSAPESGRWTVRTLTATYTVDLDERWIERHPDPPMPTMPPGYPPETLPPLVIAALRKDRERIPLLEVGRLEVGLPMVLGLQIRDDGTATVRVSTDVQSVEAAPAELPKVIRGELVE